jgi:transmembrane sensor
MHAISPRPDCRAEAERWYTRLNAPDCTASERAEFERWRATSEHAAAYEATLNLWESVGQLAGRADFQELSQQILAGTAKRPRRHFRIGVPVAATALIALAGGGLFFGFQHREIPAAVYATQPGERSTINLADGSTLVLNYGTELEVRLSQHFRMLRLRKGEALFTVAHDKSRPFKVMAGDGEVTALGTRFEVRSDAEHVEVTLLEGRIAVDRHAAKEQVELAPGDQVRFAVAVPEMTRRTVDPEVVASWSTGRLKFRSTPLEEALEEVNRYSATQIRIIDPSLTQIPINGTFQIGDSTSIVSALESLFPIESTENADGEILLRRR